MTTKHHKFVVLLFTGLVLVAAFGVSIQTAIVASRTGWSGMVVKGDNEIRKVFYDGPADRAGIRPGNEIIAINGIPADSTMQIAELAVHCMSGDSVVFRIRSDEHTVLSVFSGNFHLSRRDTTQTEIIFTATLPSAFRSLHMILLGFTSILIALIFPAIGFWLYHKRPEDRRVLVFYLLSVAAAIYFLIKPAEQATSVNALGFETTSGSPAADLIWWFLFAPLLLHLALIFPKDRPVCERNPYIIRWVYSTPVLLPVLVFFLLFIVLIHQPEIIKIASAQGFLGFELPFEVSALPPAWAVLLDLIVLALVIYMFPRWRKTATYPGQQRPLLSMTMLALVGAFTIGGVATLSTIFQLGTTVPSIILGVWLVLLVLAFMFIIVYYPLAAFAAFVRSYRQSGVEEKRQIRWPLLATIIAIGSPVIIGIVYLGHFLILRREPDALVMMLGDLFKNGIYLFIPIAFAFAILKYRLLDIDLIIKKTIIYTSITGIIVALYLSLVGGLGVLLVKFIGIKSELVTIFSTLAIAALFVPLRNRVQNVVDRRFFRKKYDYPTALKTLSREISQAVDQQVMLELVVEQLQPALQNRSVVIFSRGAYDRAYVATAKVGPPDEIIGKLKFEVDSRLLTMMHSPFEVHTQDLPEVEKHTIRKAGSAFIIPVKLKNELIAFIGLGTKLSDEDYDAEDKDFLTSVAEQMGAGVDRIRLREQERDFEKAREIQQGLLPKLTPQLPGYEIACAWQPARAVAGDYYDVIKLSESALGICIADVVGKGMPAALLMSNLQAIVRAMATEDMPPKQLCEKVNRVISNNMTPDKFITFFYCLLDAKSKQLVYTNAGHNRPILFHQDGSWMELKEGGLALGMTRERKYEQDEIQLDSGDRLLLFTDGVTEVVNTEQEEFGEQRVIDLLGNNLSLRATELQKKIIEAVTEFSRGDFQDDVTLITISVE